MTPVPSSDEVKDLYAVKMREFSEYFGRKFERNVLAAMAQFHTYGFFWPVMSREDWWQYWNQMQEACNECRNAPFSGGPSPVWPHSEHVAATNRRPWRGPR